MEEDHDGSNEGLMEMPESFVFESILADDSSDVSSYVPVEEDEHAKEDSFLVVSETQTEDTGDDASEQQNNGLSMRRCHFEIVIRPLPAEVRAEYVPVPPGDEVYRIHGRIKTRPDESWWKVEFEDGRVDQVAFDDLVRLPNGRWAMDDFKRSNMSLDEDEDELTSHSVTQLRKRKNRQDPDFFSSGGELEDEDIVDDYDDDDDDEVVYPAFKRRRSDRQSMPRSLRRSTRASSMKDSTDREDDRASHDATERPQRTHNLRTREEKSYAPQSGRMSFYGVDDDADELSRDRKDSGDDDFAVVRSDLQPHKNTKRKKLKHGRPRLIDTRADRDSDIEFEPVRRSGRSTKNTKNMKDPLGDEELYAEDDKAPVAPKIISIREIFQPLEDSSFRDVHAQVCKTCGGDASANNKGLLIYCQGCSLAYHKVCLGYRSAREHAVTKVGPEYFVLQCRYCIGVPKKKDINAPNYAMCQACHEDGPACAPFAPKKTAKQEEKLRLENGGVDPITTVSPTLINKAANVLFRCVACLRAYHFEHLPPPAAKIGQVTGDNIRAERLEEYSIDWRCKECLSAPQHNIQAMIAWRPVNRDAYQPGQITTDIVEDGKEYLIKWETQSYAHCVWKPGAWVYGVVTSIMRGAFPKRNEGGNLLPKWDEKDAIPEEYLLADVVLAVRFKGHVRHTTKEEDLLKISKIDKARIKFQGLGYDDVVWDSPPSENSGPIWDAFVSAYQEYLNGKYFKSDSLLAIRNRIEEFRSKDFQTNFELKEQPAGLRRGKLMTYQLEGLNWLLFNYHQERNVILADEMGLGKTVQVVALITTLTMQEPRCWPFLIVVPNSTCPNWRREIKKWAPDLRVVTYHGGKASQKLAYEYELFPDGSKDMKAHIVVMSYDSAQDDYTRVLFKQVRWAGLVVDEGQRLKNDSNLLYGALRAMRIPFRLLLTGTPLQNNKRELFNLLQFVDSSKNAAQLDEQYQEITAGNINELHALIRPYFLRRTKAEVLKFLPSMAQIIVPVTMSVVQEKLCKSIMAKNPDLIRAIFANSKMKATERGSLNNILMQLRKCLCHPFIYSGAIEDKSADPERMYRNLIEASSKLDLLEIMLPKLKERGHRVLLFSQFLDQLDIIEDFLVGLDLKYQRLDGQIGSLEKQKRIDAFNEPGSEYFAFLLSTRAGGVGINLATADTVIILDPDFNPHQDIQALSRAHRIGQKNKVLCFQLMTKNSVEEKIMQIGRKKMALDHVLIESMDRDDEADDNLESILKHGAEALFSEDQKDVIKYDSASVDRLLDRSQVEDTKVGDDKSAESQFSFARVWANDKGDLADDIKVDVQPGSTSINVWDNILKEREEEARRVAEMNKEVLGRGGRRRQAVKYTAKPNYGLDDGADVRDSDSEMDEDFVNNGSADETDDAADMAVAERIEPLGDTGKTNGLGSRKTPESKPKGTIPKAQKKPTPGEGKKSKSKAVDAKSQSRSQPPTPKSSKATRHKASPRTPRTPRTPKTSRNAEGVPPSSKPRDHNLQSSTQTSPGQQDHQDHLASKTSMDPEESQQSAVPGPSHSVMTPEASS